APPVKPAAQRPAADDDDALLNRALSSMNKPNPGQKPTPTKPTVAAAPPTKPQPKRVKTGEDEFWRDDA
ncbi:MAG TPA: hypothetical protein VK137_15710, partial [Planctomycetaceae bacterium]|nr:hypothetical protein [Planctomycetaceae bacterium]